MTLRFINITLLFIWTFFLLWLLTFGTNELIRLLHPRMWWVLGVAVVVLIFFLVSLFFSGRQAADRKSMFSELPAMAILLVPLMFFFIAKDARLDGSSLQNRIIMDDSGFYLNNLPPFQLFDESKTPDLAFSRILREPQKYEGQQVEVVCQSFVDEQLPGNTAMCYRYLITCCAADALPAFIFLSHDDDTDIENNRWIKVGGSLSILSNNGMEFPSIEIATTEYVAEPSFPWAM